MFPKECAGCGAEGAWLCAKCRRQLIWRSGQVCLICGRETDGFVCTGHDRSIDRVIVALDYAEAARDLIKIGKYNFSQEAIWDLAELLKIFWRERHFLIPHAAVVLPVPLTGRRYRWRGFNQAEILANAWSADQNLTCQTGWLIKKRHSQPQAKLKGVERLTNVADCFVWRGPILTGQTVILIDDVATTGATLNECARVVKGAGAGRVWGVVLAA